MIIYIAGRYRADKELMVDRHVAVAEYFGILVMEKGHFPLIPHTNTGRFERMVDYPDRIYLEGTMDLLRRCDGILMIPGWRKSEGAVAELEKAKRDGHCIFMSIDDVPWGWDEDEATLDG